MTGVAVGAAATVACSNLSGGDDEAFAGVSKKDVRCLGIGAVAGLAAGLISNRVFKDLSERDQRAAIAAATESLATGESVSIELPDSGEMFTAAPTGAATDDVEEEEILVDLARVPSLGETFAAVGRAYSAPANVNVRSGPSTQFGIVDSLAPNSAVHVFGQAEGGDWYLIGKAIEEEAEWGGLAPKPVAVGYVRGDLIREVDDSSQASPDIAWVGEDRDATATMRPVAVSWRIRCQTFEMNRADPDGGEVISGSSNVCYGPNGPKTA